MKSIIREITSKIDPELRRLVSIQGDIAVHLGETLRKKGLSQKRLAEITGMKPSRISKILMGNENLTLRTIVRLERATGSVLIESPMFRSNAGTTIPVEAQMQVASQEAARTYPVSTDTELHPVIQLTIAAAIGAVLANRASLTRLDPFAVS